MKKINIIIGLVLFSINLSAQIYTSSNTQPNITDGNVFLDASSNFNSSVNGSHSLGKGLVFPDTDLTQFQFNLTMADGIYFPSYYDGMVVYNTGTGNSLTGINNPSTSTAVTPGFYYFSNPNGTLNGNITAGQWRPLGGGAASTLLGDNVTTKVESNTIKGIFFYMPSIKLDLTGTTGNVNLHQEYLNQFSLADATTSAKNPAAPATIPTGNNPEDFYYYITYYDKTVLSNVQVSDYGVLTYQVIGAATDKTFVNVVFVQK